MVVGLGCGCGLGVRVIGLSQYRASARCMWLGRGYGSNGIRALGRGPRASAAARAWRASVALQRQVLVLVRAATGGARSLQAQLQVELHVELQVGPQRELRGVGQIVVRALLGRDRVRASPGAARRDISRAIAPIAGIDIVVIAFKQNSVSQSGSQSTISRILKGEKQPTGVFPGATSG